MAGPLGRYVNFPSPLVPIALRAPARKPVGSKYMGVVRHPYLAAADLRRRKAADGSRPSYKPRKKGMPVHPAAAAAPMAEAATPEAAVAAAATTAAPEASV